ncbi:c-type cytochrome [Massilia sp. PWRC2]|uniref:c-type cytochrome n=1 Tax=Massilia sp. PWRC2 TaxID=2804626 RepID=UPI003CF72C26
MPDSGRRAVLLLLCLLLAAVRSGAATPADTIEQRVLACTACHGSSAGRAVFPRIAGKPAGYLYNQLINFREGRRQYPQMTYMVEHLSLPYLREIADHFSKQQLAAPTVPTVDLDAAALARGRQLVLEGDRALQLPACIACHGARLTGVQPAIAGLAGLPRDYLNAQLGNWRNHTRRAQAPDCMAVIANRLSLSDVAAVSGWIARRPLPAAAAMAPAATIARPLPLACGSAPD